MMIFAPGSGSSRFSLRNRWVSQALHGVGLATLLQDLLTLQEAIADQQGVRDIAPGAVPHAADRGRGRSRRSGPSISKPAPP